MDFDAIGWDLHRRLIDPEIDQIVDLAIDPEIDPILDPVLDEARSSRPDVRAEQRRPAYVTTARPVRQVRRTRGSMTL